MSDLLEMLRQEGVDPALLAAVEEYRAAHPLAEALRPRIPVSAFTYYGKDVWEQALAALLCGENLLLAGGKATGKNVLAENLSAAFGRPAWFWCCWQVWHFERSGHAAELKISGAVHRHSR